MIHQKQAMKATGNKPSSLEVGHAWELRSPEILHTNWIVGDFPTIPMGSLRFMQQTNLAKDIVGDTAKDIAIKWFLHTPDDPAAWGVNKPTSQGRTISILAGEGEFELTFTQADQPYILTLDTPGDFAIWGPGLKHAWRPLKPSPILTVRWTPD
ncbi:MAG: hypothetical protein AAGC54_03080 [Cyanobacteria bacterium P01_F01_bin.4]